MKTVNTYYDSYWQEHRYKVESTDTKTGNPIDFCQHEIWWLKNHGFTVLTQNTATNDTFIGYAEHRTMANELNIS